MLRRAEELRDELALWGALEKRARALAEMAELAAGDADAEALTPDLERDLAALQADWSRMEGQLLLSEPYDERPAIVSVHAGAGGTESQDWAEMLERMYLRWADDHGYRTEILDQTEGEEAGLKSVTFSISGRFAYGRLRSERGVHRLVRISPFDSQKRRHTSFALVEVMPEVAEDAAVEIDDKDLRIDTYRASGAGGQHVNKTDSAVRISPFDSQKRRHTSFALVEVMPEVAEDAAVEIDDKDLRIDTYRASGAGGQHVNKTDSAVRITHLPTGIVVSCQNERSQHQNRERAMTVLRGKLVERQMEEREAEMARLRGQHVEAGWGNQIRSYVLQPYTMVKDLRTGVETSNPIAVLGGDLDAFIEGYLRSRVGEAASA